MKKNYFFCVVAILFATFVSSCSKDDDQPVVKQITKIDYSSIGEEIYLFQYDSNNRLISYIEQKSNAGVYTTAWTDLLEYGTDGKLIKQTTTSRWMLPTDKDYIDYTYKKDTVFAKKYIINDRQNDVYNDTLLLNSKGFLVKQLTYYGGKIEYKYDEKNNLIKSEYFNNLGRISETNTYEYDNTINILANQNVPGWFWAYYGDGREANVGANNAIKMYEDGKIGYELTYKDLEDNYPKSVIYGATTLKNIFTYRIIKIGGNI